MDLDQTRLRTRQVEVLTRALSQFVALKSSTEGWVPVAPAAGRWAPHTVAGGDIGVQMGKRTVTDGSSSKQMDIYRMTASIPLDPGVSRDTQGPFSAYLSELRDWQAALECPGIRSMWNYFLSSSSTLEMLDTNTTITRSVLRSPIPGRTAEFAHQRDLLTVETSLVDPTTVVYISTSLPTTPDDPAYLREQPPFKRVHSELWAWCVEIATPMDAASLSPASRTIGSGGENLLRKNKPRACVQVTCFLHLDLGSWKSHNALACSAAAYLIPSLVAHLRLLGAPPRLARIGPSISIDRRDWCQSSPSESASTPTWVVAYSVMANGGPDTLPPVAEQPVIARILDLETSSNSKPPLHMRKVSSLSSYLSNSLRRRQGEPAVLGTHGGGIVREGEEVALVATRARLGDNMVEFVIDASQWHNEGGSVDIILEVTGGCGVQQFYDSVVSMQAAAPELFTGEQLGFSLDEFLALRRSNGSPSVVRQRQSVKQEQWERGALAELAGRLLVRCFSIASQQGAKKRYLVRVMNPPVGTTAPIGLTSDRAYSVSVSVRKGSVMVQEGQAGLRVNGNSVKAIPFSLDPTTTTTKPHTFCSTASNPRSTPNAIRSDTPASAVAAGVTSTPLGLTPAPDTATGSDTLVCERSRRGSSATTSAYVAASETPGDATDGEATVELQAVPFIRLRQVSKVPMSQWKLVGTAASGGITVSRADLSALPSSSASLHTSQGAEEAILPMSTLSASRSSSASVSSNDGTTTAAAAAAVPAEHGMDGMVLRAEASVEGWTVFDVFSALSLASNGGNHMGKISGLWVSARQVEQVSANGGVHYYQSAGTWATSARDAMVCRSWSSNQRSRIEVAECSIDGLPYDMPSSLPESASAAVRADLGLSAWVLEKSTPQAVADTSSQVGSVVGRMSLRMLTNSVGDLGPQSDAARLRSGSLTTRGSAAIDAEFENQRRKQHVVRITHYVKYNPGGWMDRVAEFADQTTAVGARESAVVTRDITQLIGHLDAYGALPAAVWSRNANVVTTDVGEPDRIGFTYRLATWGAPQKRQTTGASSASSSYRQTASMAMGPMTTATEGADTEFVEVEFRIEHRVWAHGARADGTERGAASVEVVVEPFYTDSSRVACFVDPEADPHATRVRVRHHRTSLLPRVEEEAGVMVMGWPTVRVSIARTSSLPSADAVVGASSLVVPQRSGGSPLMLPWSVPPRVSVNSVPVRVRYLRRDDSARGFYARCQSVSALEAPRLARSPTETGGLFIERLPDPPAQPLTTVHPMVSSQPSSYRRRGSAAAQHHMAIQNYTVIHRPPGYSRLVTPAQFVQAMRHVFADIRHQIERLDGQSPRARWENLAAAPDMRSSAVSLRTAVGDDVDTWSCRTLGESGAVFERMDQRLHTDIPVTVAVGVLQGVGAERVSQMLQGDREWDEALFADRRTLEHVPGPVAIGYGVVRTPPFCDRRDALTVSVAERVAYLSVRQRLRNWQQPVLRGCSAGLGDYTDPAFTLVEASVPGSQPLATATRAHVALYAVRVEPIDAFERVSEARHYAFPACRVIVACCLDLAGNVPLAIRRAASARVPELHLASMAAACRLPASPYATVPASFPMLMPNADRRREIVDAEAVEELVDGLPVVFYRALGGSVTMRKESGPLGYTVSVSVTGATLRNAHGAKLRCLRNGGYSSGSEHLPSNNAAFVPVISEVVVDTQGWFAVSVSSSVILSPDDAALSIPCGVWRSGRLAVYVFALEGGNRHLVRTALLASSDSNDDDEVVATCMVSIQPTSVDAISVNGQRMRVHQALPPRQSLLFVVGASGRVLDACRECGNVACAANVPPGTQPPVAYASDESSDEDEPKDDKDSLGLGPATLLRTNSTNLATLARPQSPPLPAVQSVLRQRTGHGAAKSTVAESYDSSSVIEPATGGCAPLAARTALAVVSLAVFLPVRRLVVGRTTIGRWLLARTTGTWSEDCDRLPNKSVLALLALLFVAALCVVVGVVLARLLVVVLWK
ncbi:hypothetical protein GGI20_004055 [Coemansia sp. BCRC 34301]|nr:hypothetical protein GGI20_004055 [Coemansia sp. BCRC 34301]